MIEGKVLTPQKLACFLVESIPELGHIVAFGQNERRCFACVERHRNVYVQAAIAKGGR